MPISRNFYKIDILHTIRRTFGVSTLSNLDPTLPSSTNHNEQEKKPLNNY